jgi:amino acid transporter
MKDVDPQAGASPRPRFGLLQRNAISVLGAVALAMAFMAPGGSTFFETQPAAAGAGYATPFAFLLAMLVCLIVASTISGFARKLPAAGFAYTFNSQGLGKRTGFVSGWLLAFAYGMVGPMIFPALGAFSSDFLSSQFNVSVPWWLLTIGFVVVIWIIVVRGVSVTAGTALVFLVIEVAVFVGLGLTILAKGGAEGLSLGPLNPGNTIGGPSGLGIGVLWGILAFVGFESAGTLGEETADSRRNIPRALFAAAGLIGAFYVFIMYCAVIGFGQSHIDALVGDSTPWFTLIKTYWGAGASWILALTVINSSFANMIAGSNAAIRVVFALGRESIFPPILGRTNAKGTPVLAASGYMLFSMVMAVVVGLAIGPFGAFAFFGSILGLGIVIIWILLNISLIVFYRRRYPAEFSPVRHGVLPCVASVLMLLPLYGQLWPIPAYPNNLVPYIVVAWVIAGIGYLTVIQRRRPAVFAGMGRVWGEDAATPEPQATAMASLRVG